jgi:hypothetical protein
LFSREEKFGYDHRAEAQYETLGEGFVPHIAPMDGLLAKLRRRRLDLTGQPFEEPQPPSKRSRDSGDIMESLDSLMETALRNAGADWASKHPESSWSPVIVEEGHGDGEDECPWTTEAQQQLLGAAPLDMTFRCYQPPSNSHGG